MTTLKTTPTFTEQYDKIVGAYLKNELNEMDPCACFIGNLLNNTTGWSKLRDVDFSNHGLAQPFQPISEGLRDPEYQFYTMEEICLMENNFLKGNKACEKRL